MDPFENTSNDSIESYPSTRFYTNGLLAGVFILSGVTANILVICSWLCDRGRWLPLYYYFLAFASWNLVLLTSTFFFYSLPALLRQPADRSTINSVPYFYIVGYAGANCSLTAVVWLMVVLTIERYVAVSRPFHTRVSSPKRRAKLISATISLMAILYNIPLIFEFVIIRTRYDDQDRSIFGDQDRSMFTSIDDHHDEGQGYVWTVEPAPFRSDFYYQTLYRVLAHFVFISLVPFVIITTLTMKIVSMVQRTNTDRQYYRRAMTPPSTNLSTSRLIGSTRHSSAAAATYGNILLTVFVVKFLLCYSLPFALNVLELIVPEYIFRSNEFMWITDASDFLVILDSVSNAFLYFSWRKRIRSYKKGSAAGIASEPITRCPTVSGKGQQQQQHTQMKTFQVFVREAQM